MKKLLKKILILSTSTVGAFVALFSLATPFFAPVAAQAATCPAGYTCTAVSSLPNITSFTANPPAVMSGQSTTLLWTSVNTNFCWGAGMGPSKTFPSSYSVVRQPTGTSTIYTLTCSNSSSSPAFLSSDWESLGVQVLPAVTNCPVTVICTPAASISLDPLSPLSGLVAVTNTTLSQYLGLPILVFDINALGEPLTLNGLAVPLSLSGNGSTSVAYLYQGSKLIASAAISYVPGAVANFGKFASISIPAGSSLPLTVKVDVVGVTGSGFSVSASINPIAVSLTDPYGNSVVPSGSVQGNSVTVVPAGPLISILGTPTITKINITPPGGQQATSTFEYTANFNLQLSAIGGSVMFGLPTWYFPAVGSSSSYIQVMKNGAPDSTNDGAIVTYSQPTNTTLSTNGNYFTVAQNQSVTLPVSVSFIVYNPGANVYAVQLKGVGYSFGSLTNQIYPLSGVQTQFALVPTQGILTADVLSALQQFLNY